MASKEEEEAEEEEALSLISGDSADISPSRGRFEAWRTRKGPIGVPWV